MSWDRGAKICNSERMFSVSASYGALPIFGRVVRSGVSPLRSLVGTVHPVARSILWLALMKFLFSSTFPADINARVTSYRMSLGGSRFDCKRYTSAPPPAARFVLARWIEMHMRSLKCISGNDYGIYARSARNVPRRRRTPGPDSAAS